MKKKILLVLLVIIGTANLFAQTPKVVVSDKAGWHKIGETIVNYKAEKDELLITGANRFQTLKIKVTEAPIVLNSFDIYFKDGEMQSVPVGQEIKSAGETKEIQLDGKGERVVQKVVFNYKTVGENNDKRARLELWGLKTNEDRK